MESCIQYECRAWSTEQNDFEALEGSSGSLNQKKRVASLSPSSRLTCRKAFSIPVVKPYLWQRKRRRMPVKPLAMGGPAKRQSFRLGWAWDCRQLQSYTTRIGVLADSLNAVWCASSICLSLLFVSYFRSSYNGPRTRVKSYSMFADVCVNPHFPQFLSSCRFLRHATLLITTKLFTFSQTVLDPPPVIPSCVCYTDYDDFFKLALEQLVWSDFPSRVCFLSCPARVIHYSRRVPILSKDVWDLSGKSLLMWWYTVSRVLPAYRTEQWNNDLFKDEYITFHNTFFCWRGDDESIVRCW